jgi:hypothetical protein
VSLGIIREALRRAVDRGSLRQVAREVGLSPRGLTLVMEGTGARKERARTLTRLRDWYLLHGAAVVGSSDDVAAAAFDVILEELDPDDRDDVMEMVLAVVEQKHRRRGRAPPGWIEGLRRRRA